MALILSIDTATESASVSVGLNGISIGLLTNDRQKEHASFIHTAIETVVKNAGYTLLDIEAFAVTSGPGSYTGLRVGMATAKGFCYALSKPLITVNTLEVMAAAAIEAIGDNNDSYLYCPMIDARRMEVFTALYSNTLEVVLPPAPIILSENLFASYMKEKMIHFFGSGSTKFSGLVNNENSVFAVVNYNASHVGKMAEANFRLKKFADVSYSGPEYIKEFYTAAQQ